MLSLILVLYLTGMVASAVEDTNPLKAGNAKKWYNEQDADFQSQVISIVGAVMFIVFAVTFISLGGVAMVFASSKASGFQDPTKKSVSGTAAISIIGMVLGFFLCISFISKAFGW
jgi:hypothetical protein